MTSCVQSRLLPASRSATMAASSSFEAAAVFPASSGSTPMMNSAFSGSVAAPLPPLANTTTKSKRLSSGGGKPEFTTSEALRSYEAPRRLDRSPLQFWAAMTLHCERRRQTKPALATETVCCSMASCTAARSWLRIVENSSMQQTPPSARTRAPASNTKSGPSRTAAQVSPAFVQPKPLVRTLRPTSSCAACSSWDLPVPGSPKRSM
mmetsp:Transcript_119672/g.345932  ORF Transcript_119672/g.345932 Transcript_119672/m.345932 type:complete len:207 (+) Transcript_119672:54-674(+)